MNLHYKHVISYINRVFLLLEVFRVLESEKRDVHPQELPEIILKLRLWRDRCVELNASLEASNAQLRSDHEASRREQEQAQNVTDNIKAALQESMGGFPHVHSPQHFASYPLQGPIGALGAFLPSGGAFMR